MKNRTKLLILLVVALLMLGGWGFDVLWARAYTVEVISVSPDPGIADGQTPVTIRVRVTRGSRACQGHILHATTLNGGSFKADRVTTDDGGLAEFTYYPYLKSRLNTLTDVNLIFEDESNSFFISVPAQTQLLLHMVEAQGDDDNKNTNDSMFG